MISFHRYPTFLFLVVDSLTDQVSNKNATCENFNNRFSFCDAVSSEGQFRRHTAACSLVAIAGFFFHTVNGIPVFIRLTCRQVLRHSLPYRMPCLVFIAVLSRYIRIRVSVQHNTSIYSAVSRVLVTVIAG